MTNEEKLHRGAVAMNAIRAWIYAPYSDQKKLEPAFSILKMETIARIVAKEYGVTVEDLVSPARRASVPRRDAMRAMLAAGYCGNDIARFFKRTRRALDYAVHYSIADAKLREKESES